MTELRSAEAFIRTTTDKAIRALADTQPWPDQFRRRALEVRALSRLGDFSSALRVLELGCGNAIGSALLSPGRGLMFATDLERPDLRTHSIGLAKARALLQGLQVETCRVMAASAEALPYRDRSFDLVFSLFVLEHIADRDACLSEVHRVLDRGGLTVHAVPGMAWALDAPVRFQMYLVQRLWARLFSRDRDAAEEIGDPEISGVAPAARAGAAGFWSVFRRRYPHFPIPPPHGAYSNYFAELISYSRGRWIRLFERNGLEIVTCRPIMMLPLCLAQLVLGSAGIALYERLFDFDQWLGSRTPLRSIGRFMGIVARKPT